MFNQMFEFFICMYAFLYNIQDICAQDIGRHVLNNESTYYDSAGKTHTYYYDEEACELKACKVQNTEEAPYGGNYACASCNRSLYYDYNTTYAYSGREFCSPLCRKRFSDEDLKGSYKMEVHQHII